MKHQLVYCSHISQYDDFFTPHNHHLFKIENEFKINPYEMIIIIPRFELSQPFCIQYATYKNYRLRPKKENFILCLNVYNNSEKSISANKNTTLGSFTQLKQIKSNYLFLSENDVEKLKLNVA
jgi:hypothetical protein